MEELIRQVERAVNFWRYDYELKERFNIAVKYWEKGMLTPIDFAKELTAIYDEAMTLPF